MSYPLGGGGGKAGSISTSENFALDKPYDISGEPSADKMQQIDEMLDLLFRTLTRTATEFVQGPDGVERDENIAIFDGVTGKIIQDSGTKLSEITAAFRVASYDLTEAELETANSVPPIIIPAVADKIIIPVVFQLKLTITSIYSNNPVVSLRYNGVTQNISDTMAPVFTINGNKFLQTNAASRTLTGDPTNKGVVYFHNAELTGAGAGTAKVIVGYVLADTF